MSSPALAPVSNFGTMPHLLERHQPAEESWWIGLDRESFYARIDTEAARMQGSKGSAWVDHMRVVSLAEWI